MREPTHAEMVDGIEKAVSNKLSLAEHGFYDLKPSIAWPRAFQEAVEAFLEKHKDEIIAKLTSP